MGEAMVVLLRALGLQAAYAVMQTFSPAAARVASLFVLLAANSVPLMALLSGRWGAGDVLIAYWLENVAIGLWAAVRVATASVDGSVIDRAPDRRPRVDLAAALAAAASQSNDPRALRTIGLVARVLFLGFFLIHYGGFTLVHGIFTFSLARDVGTTGSVGGYLLMLLVMVASHGLSTAIHWFARGERRSVGPQQAMVGVYPRVVVMHLSVIGGAWLVAGAGGTHPSLPWPGLATLGPGLLLIAIKVVVDVFAHLGEHRATRLPVRAADVMS
jgi:hypothetical protein